jgi:SAM-dependent methyltransferase
VTGNQRPPPPASAAATPTDPQARFGQLTDLATPFAMRTVATLRIADLISSGTRRLGALADAAGADCDALGRLLRFLAHRGVLTETAPDEFDLTALGRLLCENGPGGGRQWLDADGLGFQMDMAYAGLTHSVRTGTAGFAAVHGRTLWEDLDAHPDRRAYFDALMLTQQLLTAPQVARLYDWSAVGHVFDIGGGSGELLAELLRTYEHLRGTLVDRPGPARASGERLADRGIDARAAFIAGDFFQPLPTGGDVYLVSRVLTDWNDRDATTILRRCGEAAGPDGKVLIVEVLPSEPHVPYLTPFDLQMLVTVGGRERTVSDFAALAARAGLDVTELRHGRAGLTLIECTPCAPC